MDGTSYNTEKEDGNAPLEANTFAPPSVIPTKGVGAIRRIGAKFAATSVTSIVLLTVSNVISPDRSSFGPKLVLAHDSGSGNRPFGFDWSLSFLPITRKTDKGLPQYRTLRSRLNSYLQYREIGSDGKKQRLSKTVIT